MFRKHNFNINILDVEKVKNTKNKDKKKLYNRNLLVNPIFEENIFQPNSDIFQNNPKLDLNLDSNNNMEEDDDEKNE